MSFQAEEEAESKDSIPEIINQIQIQEDSSDPLEFSP